MKTAPFFGLASLLLGAVFIATPVHADTPFAKNTLGDVSITEGIGGTNGYAAQTITLTSTTNLVSAAYPYVGGVPVILDQIRQGGSAVCTYDTYVDEGTYVRSHFTGCTLTAGTYYLLLSSNSAAVTTLTGSSYSTYTGGQAGNSSLAGAFSSTDAQSRGVYDFVFALCSDADCTLTPSAIDWSALYFPSVYSTSSAAIAASSTLWGAYATSTQLAAVCNTGNLLGDGICDAAQYLFVPNPHVLDGFFALPASAAQKFPFSWIYGVQTEFSSLTVASTTAMSSFTFNLGNLGIGSTTSMGNILPNTEVFSKNTIETYISPTLWATFQTLIAAAMWLSFFWYEFNRARHMAKPH